MQGFLCLNVFGRFFLLVYTPKRFATLKIGNNCLLQDQLDIACLVEQTNRISIFSFAILAVSCFALSRMRTFSLNPMCTLPLLCKILRYIIGQQIHSKLVRLSSGSCMNRSRILSLIPCLGSDFSISS